MTLRTNLLLTLPLFIFGCKEGGSGSHMQQMSDMKDSIFKDYPTVAAVTINIQDERLLVVTLGSKRLAVKSADDRQKMAGDVAAMAIRLLGKNSGVQQEKLIITPNERNDQAEPADGLVSSYNVDSLQKAMVK